MCIDDSACQRVSDTGENKEDKVGGEAKERRACCYNRVVRQLSRGGSQPYAWLSAGRALRQSSELEDARGIQEHKGMGEMKPNRVIRALQVTERFF